MTDKHIILIFGNGSARKGEERASDEALDVIATAVRLYNQEFAR